MGRGCIPLVLLIRDLGRGPAVDAANGPAGAARADRDRGGLVVERRLDRLGHLQRVAVEVDELQLVVGRGGGEERAVGVHGVDALGQLESADGLRLAHVPVAHRLVPRAGGDDGAIGGGDVDEAHCADRRRVGLDGHGLARVEVHDVNLFIGCRANGEGSVLHRSQLALTTFRVLSQG